MPFNRPSLETIYKRIKADIESRVTGGVAIPRVSLLSILAIVFAGSIHLMYGFLVWLAKQIFIDTADSYGRERWANIFNLPRKAATYTSGYIKFTGVDTTVVGEGTVVNNNEGYEYTIQDDFTIGTDNEVLVIANESGASSNTTDTYLTLSSPLEDVDSDVEVVVNPSTDTIEFDNGTDIETIEAWVYRLLQRFQNPLAAGNAANYEKWALDVAGVGKSWCIPAEIYGQGSIGLCVSTFDLLPVSSTILTNVKNYVESVRPVPAFVDYFTTVSLPTRPYISITPNTPDMQTAITTEYQNFILSESGPGETLLLSHLRNAISKSGIDDYVITDIEIYRSGWISLGVVNVEPIYPETPIYSAIQFTTL